jgi:uncharacterized membrane protein
MVEEALEQSQKTPAEKVTAVIAHFMGSWWAVVFHTLWFAVWLIFNFSLETLTLWVSLEAIFIGIFLLMASNKAEVERDKKEAAEQLRQRKMIGVDISMDRKQVNEITEIKDSIQRIEKQIAHLTKMGLDKQK